MSKAGIFFGGLSLSALSLLSCSKKNDSLRGQLEKALARQSFDSAAYDVNETRKFELAVSSSRPEGSDLKGVTQIAVTFNKPMVPLTDFEEAAKDFTVEVKSPTGTKPTCSWRWINRFTIACDLETPLPGSTAYAVHIGAGVKAFDGTTLAKAYEASFQTEQWKVVHDETEWEKPDLPVFTLAFNQSMNIDSLKKNIHSTCGNILVERIPPKKAEEFLLDADRSYIFKASAPLGLDRACEIRLMPTARSAQGPLDGQVFVKEFRTYPEFRITDVRCGGSYRKKNKEFHQLGDRYELLCNPDRSLTVDFSSPVLGKQLSGSFDVEPFFGWVSWGENSPEMLKEHGDDEQTSFTFYGPMKGRAMHRIEIKRIRDRWNRELVGVNKILVSTEDFSPMFRVEDSFGVVEKKYPTRIAINSVNVKGFDFSYRHSSRMDEVQKLYREFTGGYAECEALKKGVKDSAGLTTQTLKTGGVLNVPQHLGLNLKTQIPNFNFGYILGRVNKVQTLTSEPIDACSHFFIVKTDLGITAKLGFYDGGVWIHSIGTAKPLANVQVALWNGSEAVAQAKTDAQGFAAMPGAVSWDPERNHYFGYNDDLYIVASTTDDFSVLPFNRGQEGIRPYNFSNYEAGVYLSEEQLRASANHIVHAITDRPLYQPKQDVNFKIFSRSWEPRTFGLKVDEKIEVSVNDSQGKEIFKKELKLNDFGTANANFTLSSAATLGGYSIDAKIGDWKRNIGSFEVEEFTLPPFKVEIEGLRPLYQVGQSAAFRVKASYHFGGAVADKEGSYSLVYNEDAYRPKGTNWERYDFSNSYSLELPGYNAERSYARTILGEGKSRTDKNGITVPEVVLSPNSVHSFGRLNFEASFNDDKGKTIASSTVADVWFSDYQIGMRKKEWTYDLGSKIDIESVVLNHFEETVKGIPIKLKLVHRNYQSVRVKSSGNYFYYQTRSRDEIADTCEVVSSSSESNCRLKPKKPGTHYVVAEVQDGKKRRTLSSMYVYVTGPGYIGWDRDNTDRVELVPDKKSYNIGETAKILIKNPYTEVEALITLERFGILKQWRKKLIQGAEILEIPLDKNDYAPGFNVSVLLLKGRVSEEMKAGVDLGKPSFKIGMTKLEVVDPATILKVEAKSDRESYEPANKVKVSLNVDSPSGRNVAELSVAVVDEKILQLAGSYERSYDLHKKFYDFGYGDVVTSEMLSHLIGRRVFGKKGAISGSDGGGVKARSNFLPLAYWNPSLVTDASGKAQVEFSLPDNLTTWRVLVVASDKGHRFGFGSSTFQVSKKLMIEPALPSFLTEGDEVKARFTVFNRVGKTEQVTAKLVPGNLESVGELRDLSQKVDDKQSAIFDWTLKVPFGKKETQLDITAHAGAEADRAKYPLSIVPFVSYDTFSIYESTEKKDLTLPIKLPSDYRPELSQVELLFSSSLVQQLDEVFRYTLNYPYWCWEQTLFRAVMLNYYKQLKSYIPNFSIGREPDAWIKELLQEMPKFQASNGGMTYWDSNVDNVDPNLSAHTALSLLLLNENGFAAPVESQRKLFDYLDNLLRGKIEYPHYYSEAMKRSVKVWALYALFMNKKDVGSYLTTLYAERDQLDLFAKSFLFEIAFSDPKTEEIAAKLEKEILATAQETPARVIFQDKVDDGFKRLLYSENRTQCRLLDAFIRRNSKLPIIQPLLKSVLAYRDHGAWYNTQENLYCSQALLSYTRVYESKKPNFTMKAKVFGQDLKESQFKSYQDSYIPQALPLTKEKLGSASEIKIEKSGEGRLYVAARMRLARSAEFTKERAAGFNVYREYSVLSADKKTWKPLGAKLQVKRGDIIKIMLKVKAPANRYQVALRDSLPAGFEPINENLASAPKINAVDKEKSSPGAQSDDDAEDSSSNGWNRYSWGGGFYHREMKLQGGRFFAEFLPVGMYKIEYNAQAIATGKFNVPPAWVEEMYEPETYAHTGTSQFAIEE